jgi:hypothetical protein
MERLIACAVTTLLLAAPWGCSRDARTSGEPRAEAAPTLPAEAESPMPLPMEGMDDVMQAKLVHAQSLLEGIAIQDFIQIEHHARALAWLSQRSDWRVHTTEAYTVFSQQFRDIALTLAEDARQLDEDAVATDYVQLVHSCLTCHAYLRREGLIKDLPGAVTMARW